MLQNRLARIAIGAVSLLVMIVALIAYTVGGMSNVVPYLQGERLVLSPPVLEIKPTEGPVTYPVVLTNIGTLPVTLISANSSCSCTTISQLPITINGKDAATLEIAYRPQKSGSGVPVSLVLITDCQNQPNVPVVLRYVP